MLLLLATVGAAFVDLGPMNTALAMLISAAKAGLILLFFMQLKRETPLIRIFACVGFFWLAIMLALTLSDYSTR